jgi:septum site-determining protein MinD
MTSGKGGVGKTTSAASFAAGLALRGHKTVVVDFDVGLRNLDLIMGCERRVVFDFINVINGDARLKQALIKDKRVENLWILPTSQTRDKNALTKPGVERVLTALRQDFDYIICDSPAGIEKGALMALYFADEAVIVTNPEISSVRDSDDDVLEILAIPLLGVVPESQAVLRASNLGSPVILNTGSQPGQAYDDAVGRFLGDSIEHRFLTPERRGIFQRLLRRSA